MLIDFNTLVQKYQVKAKGVLHLGASEGQEAETYHKHGLKMAFVEALPNVYSKLVSNVSNYDAVCYNACVSDREGVEVEFNVANNGGQSSSMLEFGTHTREHPQVRFIGKEVMKTVRTENLIENIEDYDVLSMDLQGAELMALRGLGDKIKGFKYVYTEVNWDHVYKGCALIGEMDNYLAAFGFSRVETFRMPRCNWGDAFYIKNMEPKKFSNNHHAEFQVNHEQNYPPHAEFQVNHEQNYPPHNVMDFETWFKDHYKGKGQRDYLPIMWTAYQLRSEKNPSMKRSLQDYLNKLDPTKKYFTIVQHDDGIKFNLPFDCKVFGMGKESDYPLPLICEPHALKFDLPKDIVANYIGNDTHPIRRKIRPSGGWYVSRQHHDEERFCNILARSTFTICPRGYGITSFRIMEALQYGSIPVYISDRFIIPHNVPFEEYGVLVHSNDVGRLPQILMQLTPDQIKAKQARLKEVYAQYYTYESNLKLIEENL